MKSLKCRILRAVEQYHFEAVREMSKRIYTVAPADESSAIYLAGCAKGKADASDELGAIIRRIYEEESDDEQTQETRAVAHQPAGFGGNNPAEGPFD